MNLNDDARTHLPSDTLLHGGAYATGKVLGQDDVGITYEGTAISQGHQVAIKEFFPPGYTRMGSHVLRDFDSSAALEQFLNDGQALVGLHRPGSANVLEAFEENNTAYLVTELLPGKEPEHEVEESQPLPGQETPAAVLQAELPYHDIQPVEAVEIQYEAPPVLFPVETQQEAPPMPSPVETPPLFSPPAPPSDWLPTPAKSRRCPRCGSVSPKTATHCVACNTSLIATSPPEAKWKLRTFHYVLIFIFILFFALLEQYS